MRLMNVLVAVAIFIFSGSASDAFDAKKKPDKKANDKKAKDKKGKGKTDPVVLKQDSDLVHELQGVFHTLDHAAVRYGGHRDHAMKEIKAAIGALEKEMHKHGQKPVGHKHKHFQSDGVSDAHLHHAMAQLKAVAGHLAGMTKSPMRGAAADHIGKALHEVNHSLALAADHAIAHRLRHAFNVLDKADPIYAGHRANAKHEINSAIGALEKELHQHGLKGHHHKHPDIPRWVSDLEVKAVHTMLVSTLKDMSSLPPTAWRGSAGGHVKKAIAEINTALLVPRDHVYVGELRAIFKLLDKGDILYGGHRGKALEEINHAIGSLEKEMAVHGLKAHHHPHAWEGEDASHWRVRHARHALQRVKAKIALHATTDNRKKATAHVTVAVNHLTAAVAIINTEK